MPAAAARQQPHSWMQLGSPAHSLSHVLSQVLLAPEELVDPESGRQVP